MVSPRRGFALIAALWLLVALATLALGLAAAFRDRRTGVINMIDATHARLAADAGIEDLRANLSASLTRPAETRYLARLMQERFSTADTINTGRAWYVTRSRDLGATINLNRATEEELRRLFNALRIDAGEADRIAQAVLDWIDSDDQRRARGAERAFYLERRAAVLPGNAPFVHESSLRNVRGVTPEIYRMVSPLVSVGGSGVVNLSTAPREVLFTLPGFGEEAVAYVLRDRSRNGAPDVQVLATRLSPSSRKAITPFLPELAARTTTVAREYEVCSDGFVRDSPVSARACAILHIAGATLLTHQRRYM